MRGTFVSKQNSSYVAWCRGGGALLEALGNGTSDSYSDCNGMRHDVKQVHTLSGEIIDKGWFVVARPVRDDQGVEREASTAFRLVASDSHLDDTPESRNSSCIVLARPATGRWHQVRRHLHGLSHPILGDNEHGDYKVNRYWRRQKGFPSSRLALHLHNLQLPQTDHTPAIDVTAPLPPDLYDVMRKEVSAGFLQALGQSLPFLIRS